MNFPGRFGDHILPDKIHQINLSFIVNKFERRRGGTGGNVSYSMALLDTPHVLFSVAGKDFGEYEKAFQELKINLKNILIDKNNYTSTGFSMNDKINNQVWGYFYGASEKIKDLKLKDLYSHPKGVASDNDLLLIGPCGVEGSMSLVRQAVKIGASYMFDPGFILTAVSNSDLELGVANCKYLIGNDYEMNLIKTKVKNWKKIFWEKIVITTLGGKGAIIEDKNKIYKIMAAKPKKVLDPTGAGDAWRAGFLAGLDRGFNLQICGQMGSVASAYAVENYGSQEHIYTKKEFENRYRQNFKSLIKL
ncbi:MAG: PfkB family carbohydrate kinase [Candidatus Levybacteria bacterium]|nr:PfkB family carbohydrate kinase [Candidatus Levybacteria bacterium]